MAVGGGDLTAAAEVSAPVDRVARRASCSAMTPRQPSLRAVAVVLLAVVLAASAASAQAPFAPPALHALLPHAALDLLATGPVAALSLPDASPVDAGRRQLAARLLAALRSRARTLRTASVGPGTVPVMMARWSAMVGEGTALVTLARRVAEARDPALTAEALVLVGESFETIATQGAWMHAFIEDLSPHCGTGNPLAEESRSIVQEIRSSSTPRPELVARLREVARVAQQRAAADARRNRWRSTLDGHEIATLRTEAPAARQVAIVFYATAFQLSLTHQSVSTVAWRALDRMQAEENRPLLDEALQHQSLVTDHASWEAMLQPGATLLERAPLGPVALAP